MCAQKIPKSVSMANGRAQLFRCKEGRPARLLVRQGPTSSYSQLTSSDLGVIVRQPDSWFLDIPATLSSAAELVDHVVVDQPSELEAKLEASGAAAAHRLDPDAGVMVQAVWFDLGSDHPGRLLLVIHHLVVDIVSWSVISDDLADHGRWRPTPSSTSVPRLRRQARRAPPPTGRPGRSGVLGGILADLRPRSRTAGRSIRPLTVVPRPRPSPSPLTRPRRPLAQHGPHRLPRRGHRRAPDRAGRGPGPVAGPLNLRRGRGARATLADRRRHRASRQRPRRRRPDPDRRLVHYRPAPLRFDLPASTSTAP